MSHILSIYSILEIIVLSVSIIVSGDHEIDYSLVEKVHSNFNYLRSTLDTPNLCDHLYQKNWFDDEDMQIIRVEQTECRKADRFLQKLLTKGLSEDLYNAFIESLEACHQGYVVTELESTIRDLHEGIRHDRFATLC